MYVIHPVLLEKKQSTLNPLTMDSENNNSASVLPISERIIIDPVLPVFEDVVESVLPDVLINGKDIINKDGCIRELVVERTNESIGHIGFNLTRSQWDPYPWVRSVDGDSPSGKAGLLEGDCLLRVGSQDLLGLKVSEVAQLVRTSGRLVTLAVWSCELPGKDWDPEALFCGPLPGALQRVGACLAAILRAAECPVCGGSVRPPALQCPRGHLICARCRPRLPACPLCRAPLVPNATRNLLADEIYNCVVESFELKAGAEGTHLTRALLGDKAKFTKLQGAAGPHGINSLQGTSTSNGFPEHDGPKGIRWGTQRLLDRLLPGRARSTGNISRTRSPTGSTSLLAEDRDLSCPDLSRSLSTLDIQRSRAPPSRPSSLDSLACSCTSLPSTTSAFHGNSEAVAIPCPSAMSFHCPVNADCTELIKGTLHEHAISKHACPVLLVPGTSLVLSPSPSSTQPALFAHGRWFYPKCERNERNKGVRVWCWVAAPREVASHYQISVEVIPKGEKQFGRKKDTLKAMENVMETSYEDDEHRNRSFEESRHLFKDKDANNHINRDEHCNEKAKKHIGRDMKTIKAMEYGIERHEDEKVNSRRLNKDGLSHTDAKKHVGSDKGMHDSLVYAADADENGSELERWADIPIGDGCSSREDLATLEEAVEEADEPLLTLAAEVLSLIQDPWSQVVSSGRSLFLSEKLIKQDVQIRLSIGLRYAEPTN